MTRFLIYAAAAAFMGLAACNEQPEKNTRGVLYESLTGEVESDP